MADIKDEFSRVLATDSGVSVLKHIFTECGYDQPSVHLNPYSREVNLQGTAYNEGKRDIWIRLRQLISKDNLALIELAQEIESKPDEQTKPIAEIQESEYGRRNERRRNGFREINEYYDNINTGGTDTRSAD